MTRNILSNCRKNVDFVTATAWLDEHGIEWELHPPRGRGHPFLKISCNGMTRKHTVASSPCARVNKGYVRRKVEALVREMQAG